MSARWTETDVLVVGAGPAGLTTAIALARRGVACRVVDAVEAPQHSTRGCTVWQRTLETFDLLGLPTDEYIAEGVQYRSRVYHLGATVLGEVDLREPVSPRPLPLVVGQDVTEQMLRDGLRRHGGTVSFGTELIAFEQDDTGVSAVLQHAGERERVRARWLVGAQGSRSSVRDGLGISWEGVRFAGLRVMQADGYIRGALPLSREGAHMFFAPGGHVGCVPLPGGRFRIFAAGPQPAPGVREEPVDRELTRSLQQITGIPAEVYGTRFTWRIRLQNRIAGDFRRGRCFLVGDSARVFAPATAQGMNTGIQDALNLGWKLAAVVRGEAPEAVLDTYDTERRAEAVQLLAQTERVLRAGTAEQPDADAMRASIARTRARRTELTLRYAAGPLTAGHEEGDGPVAGGRAPDAVVPGGGTLWSTLAGDGRPALILTAGPAPVPAWLRALAGAHRDVVHVLVDDGRPGTLAPYRGDRALVHVVRPDGYVGFRSGADTAEALLAYLGVLFDRTITTA